MPRLLDAAELERQLAGLPGWHGSSEMIRSAYTFPDFLTGIQAVGAAANEAEELNHHPDIDIRWRTVSFALSTHDSGGVTQLDIELAHRIHDSCTQVGGTTATG